MAAEIFQKEFESVKSDLSNLKKHTDQLLGTALGKGTDAANSTFETVKNSSMKVVETCKNSIEKHPIACILIALGAGFVVGKMMNHNNNGYK